MRNTLCILGLAAAWLAPVPAWAQHTLALDQALNQAALTSPELAAATKEIDAQSGAARQAGAWRNPELSTTLEGSRADSRTTTVTLAVPLEWGDKRSARIRAAERAVDVATADRAQRQAEVRARVLLAYFQALVAQERVQLAQTSAELARNAAAAVAKRVTAGKVSPVELNRARVDEANAQLELSEAQGAWRTARLGLALGMGERTPSFEAVSDDGVRRPQRPAFAELAAQLDSYPAVARGGQEARRREAVAAMERSKRLPDVTLTVGTKRDATSGGSQAVMGLSLPLPLFDRNEGAILEATRRAEQAQDELQATRLQVLNDLQEASNQLSVASTNLQVLEAVVLPAARQAREDASTGFDAGKFSFLDVLDAQRALLQARTRYLNTLASAYQAAAAIDRITGR